MSQLNDVSECLQRTQHECEAIARRCGEKEKGARHSRESGSTESEYSSEDLRVERLLLLAQSVLRQQQKSPSPPGTREPEGTVTQSRVIWSCSSLGRWLSMHTYLGPAGSWVRYALPHDARAVDGRVNSPVAAAGEKMNFLIKNKSIL